MAGFVFGVFGYYLLKEGKKAGNFWFMSVGLFLMVYPLFVQGDFLVWAVGGAALGSLLL